MRAKKGIVSSNKQDKTIVVTVHTYKNHPKYKKRYRVSSKFLRCFQTLLKKTYQPIALLVSRALK